MRKVSRALGALLLAAAVASAPAATLEARPAHDPGRPWHDAALDILHDLFDGWSPTQLLARNEATPSFDPNGQKAKLRTGEPNGLAPSIDAAGRQRGAKILRNLPKM